MKALLVGVGGFGSSWYRRIRSQHGDVTLAVADSDESKRSQIEGDGIPFYTSLTEAIEQERPDVLLNVTPRQAHKAINDIAFGYKLPVFSEKPIAANYEDAKAMVERAAAEGIPYMIAENYRRFPFVRKLKRLLDEGSIGAVLTVDGEFYRDTDNRPMQDKLDVLEELVVHHFDLVRYLTGREVGKVFATYRHQLHIVMDMQAAITATFTCSTRSKGKQTDWAGNWRIEGTEGCLELIDNVVYLTKGGETTRFDDFSDIVSPGAFAEFLQSLEENREAETSARDYLKNQALAHYTRESIRQSQMVDTSSSWGYGPMIVRNYLEAEFGEPGVSHHGKGLTYGKRLFSNEDFDTPIQFMGYSELPPGTSIGYHGHREDEEVYIILEGTGVMTVNGEERQVKAGDIVLNKPWWKHGLENNGDRPLRAIIFEVMKKS
ncbi:Putative oxidoreductase YteT precursor [Paenibacillus konkukensis]|uniref:Oxidoreductase YteT n=1 Tax=Paenibacillus konkukensis TaxID=2020716 RepID=A0ABY4RTY1_9BACL|nr:cupin domain-containing protein [Paenibacillus konkukensis]UQZ86064.1 Putative oxidoreductase YteT precursor [Paenibacillus konkukensis]